MSNADELRDANPWHPMTKPIDLKHLGKLAEELSEGAAAAFAYLESGGVEEMQALANEIADIEANISLVAEHFSLREDVVLDHRASGVRLLPRLFRFGQRMGVAGAAVSRCIIQGIDEREPVTGKLNRDWLCESLVEIISTIPPIVASLNLDRKAMDLRCGRKMAHLRQWHGMLEEAK